jgi:hypothetical protein
VEQFWRDGYLANVPVLSSAEVDSILAGAPPCKRRLTPSKKSTLSLRRGVLTRDMASCTSFTPTSPVTQTTSSCTRSATGACFQTCTTLFSTNASPSVSPHWSAAPLSFLTPQLVRGQVVSVRFFHDQLFCKPPHHGGVVAWHQDYSVWALRLA